MNQFWKFVNLSETESELRIEGEIVSDDDAWIYELFGIKHSAPNSFRSALSEHAGKHITIWIDSYGGDVTAGVGIHNAMKEHKGGVTTKIDGKAMSSASIIAMAGDDVLMSPGSLMLIHNPWSGAVGEAKDMRHTADMLDEVKEAIVNIYQKKTGLSRNKISRLMDEETMMSSKKAIAEGFATGELYAEATVAKNDFSFSRLAIQNSAESAMKRFFEQWQKIEAGKNKPPESPKDTPQPRVIDIAKRVSVREKQNRRYGQ